MIVCKQREASMAYDVTKSDSEWRAALDPQEFQVLRKAATERPWSGALLDEHRDGLFRCKACDAPLFKSTAKFESGSGWPSFFEPVSDDAVELISDRSLGMTRTEVRCARCGSHLGHLFDDAPQTPTGERYCMNSVSLSFDDHAEA
jgi:peptide-methionine (R)-S-oxide reductase